MWVFGLDQILAQKTKEPLIVQNQKEKENFSLKSSIAQFFTDLFHGGADSEVFRSASMYEFGANSSNNGNSLYFNRNDEMSNHDHYQKIICQLTVSNSNLMRENELLKRKQEQLESLLNDHVQHLNSVYYTLFRNGYTALQFPDGEQVHLSQFYGALLHFVVDKDCVTKRQQNLRRTNNTEQSLVNEIATALKERRTEQRTSDLSSDSSISLADSDELKTAMLKCITRPKYNDIDEFVNWLSQDHSLVQQSVRENSLSSPSYNQQQQLQSQPQTQQQQQQQPQQQQQQQQCQESNHIDDRKQLEAKEKSKSLEERLEQRLRLNRTPLQRASRIDEMSMSITSMPFFQQNVRALSESELRMPDSSRNYAELSPSTIPKVNLQFNSNKTPTINFNGSLSARTAKNKTARLRAQSVGGSKIFSSSRRSTLNKCAERNDALNVPRKSLTAMRSPILTLGRPQPTKSLRNLI